MSTKREGVQFTVCVALASVVPALVASGCLSTHSEPVVKNNQCTACHGDPQRPGDPVSQAAPPFDLNGNSESNARGVGAHQAHLTESETHAAIACTECHKIPDKVFSPGHMDNPKGATLSFGTLATANQSLQPSYDYNTTTCANTYCHQAYSTDNAPNWRNPKGSATACGTCHGLPPAAPHPQNDQCFLCHGSVIDKDRHFVNKALHINGKNDTGSLTCNSCHGAGQNGAPPPDLEGNVATSAPGVGAHTIHLNDTPSHAAVPCSTCHVVPTNVDSAGHIDSARPADVTFAGLSTQASQPNYDYSEHTCSGTYCHGGATPVWNAPRSTKDACGTCHGLPPPAPHPQKQDCSLCHAQVIGADRKFVNASLHVNGKPDVSAPCNACHGTTSNEAPPLDLSGNTSVTSPGVGAHQRHLQASVTHGPVACNECHVVPSAWDSSGHDVNASPPAVITFGATATAKGTLTPAYSATSHTCTNTYCHASATPNWIAQRGDSTTCGTCHALPPPFVPNVAISAQSHPKVADCSRCHGMVIGSDGTFVAPKLHVNGVPDVTPLGCGSCHGSDASGAPPTDLSGNTDVTAMGVGAHQAHVTGGKVGRPVPCQECHIVPKSIDAPGHIDDWGQAEVTFSGAALYGNRSPVWNRSNGTCTDSWCHAPATLGNVSPVWNVPAGTLGCISCHGTPPAAPHPQDPACNHCHFNMKSDFTFIDINKHVNGSIDF